MLLVYPIFYILVQGSRGVLQNVRYMWNVSFTCKIVYQ